MKWIYLTAGMARKPVKALAAVSKAMETWSDSIDETLIGISSEKTNTVMLYERRLQVML